MSEVEIRQKLRIKLLNSQSNLYLMRRAMLTKINNSITGKVIIIHSKINAICLECLRILLTNVLTLSLVGLTENSALSGRYNHLLTNTQQLHHICISLE